MLNSIFLQDACPVGILAGMGAAAICFYLLIIIIVIVANWKIYRKAGYGGWECIIPIYNMYVMCKICQRPGWWLILMLIPLVNTVISIILFVDLARVFGKSTGFIFGLIFLAPIFQLILAFDNSKYLPNETTANI